MLFYPIVQGIVYYIEADCFVDMTAAYFRNHILFKGQSKSKFLRLPKADGAPSLLRLFYA